MGCELPLRVCCLAAGEKGTKTKGTELDERIEKREKGSKELECYTQNCHWFHYKPFYRCFITCLLVLKTQTSLDEIWAFTNSAQGNKTQGKLCDPPLAWLLLSYITDKTNSRLGFLRLSLLFSIFSSWLKVNFYKLLIHNSV